MCKLLPKNEQWKRQLDSLKAMHIDIFQEIGEGNKVAYLDFPMHFNVGDLLIYKGTEQFFKDYNINVVYRENKTKLIVNYTAINKADVILFHGGGNFGDLYPDFQKYRNRVIKKFPHKKIIILPQTIFFKDESNLKNSACLLKSHKNLLLYVRDSDSLNLAIKYGINAKLLPDMAHSLHPLKHKSEVGFSNRQPARILNLQRADREKSCMEEGGRTILKRKFDWKDLITTADIMIYTICKVLLKIPIIRVCFISIYSKLTDDVVFKAVFYFEQYDVIHTDRLHGFILSVLLGKEVFLKDNNYGKNTRYCSTWLDQYLFFSVDK